MQPLQLIGLDVEWASGRNTHRCSIYINLVRLYMWFVYTKWCNQEENIDKKSDERDGETEAPNIKCLVSQIYISENQLPTAHRKYTSSSSSSSSTHKSNKTTRTKMWNALCYINYLCDQKHAEQVVNAYVRCGKFMVIYDLNMYFKHTILNGMFHISSFFSYSSMIMILC